MSFEPVLLRTGSDLPPQYPFNYQVSRSTVVIRVSTFLKGRPRPLDLALCLLIAANAVNDQPSIDTDMDASPYAFGIRSSKIVVHPTSLDELTWRLWGIVVRGFTEFFLKYEALYLSFIIYVDGVFRGDGSIRPHY